MTCVKHNFCTDCPLRMGCRIRYGFYSEDDISYETVLQLAEIYAIAKAHIPVEGAAEAVQQIRKKRERELMIYPHFSYK